MHFLKSHNAYQLVSVQTMYRFSFFVTEVEIAMQHDQSVYIYY